MSRFFRGVLDVNMLLLSIGKSIQNEIVAGINILLVSTGTLTLVKKRIKERLGV